MPKITLYPSGISLEYEPGQSLLEILVKHNIYMDNPCNGKGTCEKCQVEINGKVQLSCQMYPTTDIEAKLLKQEKEHVVLTTGYLPDFERDALTEEQTYGLAIDIGTTTVVCSLIDMKNGKEITSASVVNPQKKYGFDVLTRISYEIEHPDSGIKELQESIVSGLNELIEETCKKANISKSDVSKAAVAANTTMLHMLLGVDARPIGQAPYEPVFLEAQEVDAEKIGLKVGEKAKVYCLPNASAYVGSDIIAGIHVCDLPNMAGNVLFIDIGTNGEMALSRNGKLLSCSCAAGPALEGMNITAGMRAEAGAIEDLKINENGMELQVIGDVAPSGICGSGILNAIKELLRTGIIRKEGAFIRLEKLDEDDYRRKYIRMDGKKREFLLAPEQGIIISQSDVRQVQLAKGAILSGIIALLNAADLPMDALDKVIVAGQFGSHLSADCLVGTGILPKEVKDKITYVGNTSKTGAYMALLSNKARKQMEDMAKCIEHIELSKLDSYERLFADCLIFPDYSKA